MILIKTALCLYFLALLCRKIFRNSSFSLGTWGGVAMGVGTLAGSAISTFGSRGGRGGVGGGISMKDLPSFWSDPIFGKTQDYMYDYGTDLLEGNPNDYYKPLGEVGGSMFEDYLSMVNRDTTKAVEESAIRRGTARGGSVDSVVAKTVADTSKQMRWSDFLRAMEGRTNFLKLGTNQVQTVGDNALSNQSQKNQFELEKAKIAAGLFSDGMRYGSQSSGGEGVASLINTAAGVAGDMDWSKLISMVGGSNNGSQAASPTSGDLSSAMLWEQNQGRGRYTIG
jgi:hypothetical protein